MAAIDNLIRSDLSRPRDAPTGAIPLFSGVGTRIANRTEFVAVIPVGPVVAVGEFHQKIQTSWHKRTVQGRYRPLGSLFLVKQYSPVCAIYLLVENAVDNGMKFELITEKNGLLIRRLVLEPGESTNWNQNEGYSFSVVVRGWRLAREYRDCGERREYDVYPGMTGWSLPEQRLHRISNIGRDTYEAVVTCYGRANSGMRKRLR